MWIIFKPGLNIDWLPYPSLGQWLVGGSWDSWSQHLLPGWFSPARGALLVSQVAVQLPPPFPYSSPPYSPTKIPSRNSTKRAEMPSQLQRVTFLAMISFLPQAKAEIWA